MPTAPCSSDRREVRRRPGRHRSTLAVALGEDAGTLEEVYEPYLIQQGLIQRTPRGRVLTPRGRRALGLPELPADPARPEAPPLFD